MLNVYTNMQDEKTVSDHDKESTSKTNNDGYPKAAETQAWVKSKKEKGKSCCSLRRCFAAIGCCCTVKKRKKIENKIDSDKKSLTSQEVNEFIEEEMKKLSEETINLES